MAVTVVVLLASHKCESEYNESKWDMLETSYWVDQKVLLEFLHCYRKHIITGKDPDVGKD